MKVLLLGANGMLGHKLHETLATEMDVVSTCRRPLESLPVDSSPFFKHGSVVDSVDLSDLTRLGEIACDFAPDVLINCAGIIKQRTAAKDAIPSIRINALLPHQLAAICSDLGVRLVHFSTDCVFSGVVGDYSEDDAPDASDLYGRTKLLGEVTDGNVLTIRTSIIGRELDHFDSLLEWFLRQRGDVLGYTKAIFSGLTTLQLARIVKVLLSEHPRLRGLYHVASPPIDKYKLLSLLRDQLGLAGEVSLSPDDSLVCDRSLRADRFVQATGIGTPGWHEMLIDLAGDSERYGRVSR